MATIDGARAGAHAARWSVPDEEAHGWMLRFTVSRDEEHVCLVIEDGDGRHDLGERIHHYPLLLLVRQRLAHMRRGIDAASAGWVSCTDLARMLGLDLSHLYVQMFRVRRQILAAGLDPSRAAAVIERRRGQVRAAALSVWIAQGDAVLAADLSGPQAACTGPVEGDPAFSLPGR